VTSNRAEQLTYGRSALLLGSVTVALSLFTALTAWALSSPPGASWTERESMLAIWCGGRDTSGCNQNPNEPEEYQISVALGEDPCFAGVENSARCLSEIRWIEKEGVLIDELASRLPSISAPFHGVLRTFVTADPVLSVIRMRLVMVAMCGLLAGACLLALGRHGVNFTRFWFFVWLPVGWYSVSSIGSAGWSLLGAVSCMVGTHSLLYLRDRLWRTFLAVSLVGYGVISSIVSGSHGLLIAGTSMALPCIFMYSQRRPAISNSDGRSKAGDKESALSVAQLSISMLLLTGTLIEQFARLGPKSQGLSDGAIHRFLESVFMFPNYLFGFVGGPNFKFGLSDTQVPIIGPLSSLAALALLYFCLRSPVSGRPNSRYMLVAAGLIALTSYRVWNGVRDLDEVSQTNALLPITSVLLLAYSLRSSGGFDSRALAVIGALGTLAYSSSLWRIIRRFANGLPSDTSTQSSCVFCQLPSDRWWWDSWNSRVAGPEVTWLLGVFAVVILFVVLRQLEVRERYSPTSVTKLTGLSLLVLAVASGVLLVQPWV